MQTFLPLPDFIKSAKCLDNKRLGKQRVEARQILNTIQRIKQQPNIKIAWCHHPAVLMWQNYEEALKLYMNTCIEEWKNRGFKNTMVIENVLNIEYPWWFGYDLLHTSHRSNLLRKNFEFYKHYNWSESNDIPYFWPIKLCKTN